MEVEFIVNKTVTIILSPANEMEEQILKQLMKQDNDISEIRTPVQVFGKSHKNCIIIGQVQSSKHTDEGQKEAV